MKYIKLISLLTILSLLGGCKNGTSASGKLVSSGNIKYAKGFDINHYENYRQVTVFNPWVKNGVMQNFYLVSSDTVETPSDGIKIKTPIKSIAISSCTYTEFLQLIGEIDKVTAMCSPEMIYNEYLRNKFAEGKIISMGDAYNTNIEYLLLAKPDIYMAANYNQKDNNSDRIIKSGVNLVYNNEWTETSLLGRAEWIKFVASFFNQDSRADSIFNSMEEEYNKVKDLAKNMPDKPTVMAGSNFKGTWYVPGGKSYMGQAFVDAGADYFYASDSTSTSLPLSFETVLDIFHDADVWLNAPTSTMTELETMDSRHKMFKAFNTDNVYSFYARTKPGGANDFWESGVAHPDLILKDLIFALHPTIIPDYTPVYMIKVE